MAIMFSICLLNYTSELLVPLLHDA